MQTIVIFSSLLGLYSCQENAITSKSQEKEPGSLSKKITWKNKFPSLWSVAYASDDVRPEDVTYEQFISAVANSIKNDPDAQKSFKGDKGDKGDSVPYAIIDDDLKYGRAYSFSYEVPRSNSGGYAFKLFQKPFTHLPKYIVGVSCIAKSETTDNIIEVRVNFSNQANFGNIAHETISYLQLTRVQGNSFSGTDDFLNPVLISGSNFGDLNSYTYQIEKVSSTGVAISELSCRVKAIMYPRK
jgi:hypothetical protein